MKSVLRGVAVLLMVSTVAACSSTTETAKAEEAETNNRAAQQVAGDCRSTGSRLSRRC